MPPPDHVNIDRPKAKSARPLRAIVPFIRPYLGRLFLALLVLVAASAAAKPSFLSHLASRAHVDLNRGAHHLLRLHEDGADARDGRGRGDREVLHGVDVDVHAKFISDWLPV